MLNAKCQHKLQIFFFKKKRLLQIFFSDVPSLINHMTIIKNKEGVFENLNSELNVGSNLEFTQIVPRGIHPLKLNFQTL